MNAITIRDVDFPKLVVSVDYNPIEAILETASARTFMSEIYIFDKYGRNKRYYSNQVQVLATQDEECNVDGRFMRNVEIQNESTRISIIVVKDLQFNLILGEDFMEKLKEKINFGEQSWITLRFKANQNV